MNISPFDQFVIIIISQFKLDQMSNQPKGGMQFFKKFADKGGSLFGGMKIKGPKENKNVAQTETSFSFNDRPSQELKSPQNATRDDISLKQQKKEIDQPSTPEIKPEDLTIKKNNTKVSEIIVPPKIIEPVEPQIKKVEQPPKLTKEQQKIEVVEVKNTQSQKPEIVQQKKSEKSSPVPVPMERKKSQRVGVKKSEDAVIRKASMTLKQQKKKQQEQKPKKSDKDQVLDQINQYNVKLAQSVITQRNIQLRICQIRESISEFRESINHWVSEQSLCAEREEYEEADRLQNRIEETQNKIDELIIEMNFAEDQHLKQENQEISILKNQNANLKKIGRKLKFIELQLQDDAANIKREEIEKIENLKNKQEIERKKIQRIQRDITYQSEQIIEFEKIFKQELDSKLNPLFKEKSKLQIEKSDLQSEIKELQRKLKEKKAQLNETNKGLKSVNDSLTQINESYKEESTKLQQRKNKLGLLENEHDEMKLEMDNMEHTISEQSKTMEAKIQKKLSEAIQMSALAKSIDQKQLNFDVELENRKVVFDKFTQNGKILKEFEQKHRQQKNKIKEIQYKKNAITADISKLQQKRDQIRKKIPLIQVEQKRFADQKNFKAAGLKKNEIKQLNDELAAVKQKIEASLIEEHSLCIEEEKLASAQKQTNEQEQTLQKNLAISQYNYYSMKIAKISEYKEAISKSSTLNPKEKEKLIKQLTEVLMKKSQELNYLNETYQLSSYSKPNASDEEQLIQADNGDIDLQEESNENKHVDNNNHHQEAAEHLVEENEDERIEEEEQSGYVPLQLD